MHVRDGTEQTETKQCRTHFLKRLRRNKQQRQTGKRIKDKFRKNRKEARSKLINENCIVFDMEGSKKDIIRTLSGELYRAGKITDTEEFYQDVLAREAITPTFVGFDMGLPHGKTDHVLEASVCFGRTKEPVVWNEESGETADLIILIAVPLSEAGDTHLKILANLSRRLMHEEFRESLRSSTREQVYTILEEVLEG